MALITQPETGARSASGPETRGSTKRFGRAPSPLLFLAPFGVLFVAMMLAPIGYSLYQSLFELQRSGLGLTEPTTVFAGLDHYVAVLQDGEFWASVRRVFTLGLVQVPVMLGLALMLALLLDSRAAIFKRTFRLVYFLPFALPGVIAAILWSFLYTPSTSPFTAALRNVGLEVNFLSGDLVLASIGNMMTWGFTGYNMLIIYSALQAIPSELHDAAAMDGCSGWRFAWHVKIPLVRPALGLTALFSIIGTAQLFNDPVILQKVSPAVTANYTPIMAVKQSADLTNYNYAAAQSIILAALTFVLSFGFLKLMQRRGSLS